MRTSRLLALDFFPDRLPGSTASAKIRRRSRRRQRPTTSAIMMTPSRRRRVLMIGRQFCRLGSRHPYFHLQPRKSGQ
jgi:hypothetical protein